MGERRPDGGRPHRRLRARSGRFWSYYRPRFQSLDDERRRGARRADRRVELHGRADRGRGLGPLGIPDFRTPETGLWANVDPMKVAHIDVFERDPARFWSYYRPRFHSLGDKRPNAAHEALAELERRGLLEGVITQNIDRLHRAAGSENVVEVHGSIETSSCTRCAASFGIEEVDGLFDEEGVAICTTCGGAVKPDVVLFGELLPESAMAMAQRARRAGRADDLRRLLAGRLPGRPALPRLTLEHGGRLAIVTKGPTPYDGDAELKLEGEVDEELGAAARRRWPRPSPSEPDAFRVAGVDDRMRARVVEARGPRADLASPWLRSRRSVRCRRGRRPRFRCSRRGGRRVRRAAGGRCGWAGRAGARIAIVVTDEDRR